MTKDPDRDEAVEANKTMNREFNDKGRQPRERQDGSDAMPDADDIKEQGIEEANNAARVRKPFP